MISSITEVHAEFGVSPEEAEIALGKGSLDSAFGNVLNRAMRSEGRKRH